MMTNFLVIMEKAVCTLGLITLQDQKIKSNNCHCLCVGRLINILVLFLLQHLNWIKSYSTMKIRRIFFVWVYSLFPIFIQINPFQFLECIYKKSGRQFGSRLPGFSGPIRFAKPDTFEFNMVTFNGGFTYKLEWSIIFIWSYWWKFWII